MSLQSFVLLILGLLAAAEPAVGRVTAPGSGAIGIDFVGQGTAMGTAEVAGVVLRPNWNSATGSSWLAPLALVDEFGAAIGVTLKWTSDNVARTGITNQAGNYRLMGGSVEAGGSGSVRAVVSGLPGSSSNRSAVAPVNGIQIVPISSTPTDTTPPEPGTSPANEAPTPGPALTFSLSGVLTPAAAGVGATVTLVGTDVASVMVVQSGAYSFGALAPGAYTVAPAKTGYTFSPSTRTVTITSTSVTAVDFSGSPVGHTMTRANSYDDAWQSAWVARGRSILPVTGKTDGFVLEIGDSITHSRAYSAWARGGDGRTGDDVHVMDWARAPSWSSTQTDTSNKNGWYLAGADTTGQRGMTASGGLSLAEFMAGCCNGGPAMPPESNGATARQVIANPTYTGNLQIDTLIAAFSDAQFAVLMLGTNDPENAFRLADVEAIVTKLEATGIVPILSTIPPRSDTFSNQLNIDFNAGVRALAEARSLPLIDFYQEIVLRQPGTAWFGTLISSDGVHPTGDRAGYSVSSNPYTPGGDPWTHTTGDAAANVGYLLRSWLTVQKLKEVRLHIVDRIDP